MIPPEETQDKRDLTHEERSLVLFVEQDASRCSAAGWAPCVELLHADRDIHAMANTQARARPATQGQQYDKQARTSA